MQTGLAARHPQELYRMACARRGVTGGVVLETSINDLSVDYGGRICGGGGTGE